MSQGLALLRRCVSEVIGLFVDNGAHTALIVGWIALASWLLPVIGAGVGSGFVLFAGLAVIFVATTTRE